MEKTFIIQVEYPEVTFENSPQEIELIIKEK